MPQVQSAVKALILNDDKFLVVKQVVHGQDFWDLPGGRVQYKETPHAALLREVKEETGLEVDISKTLGMWWFFRVVDNHQVNCTTFLCSPKHTTIDLAQNPIDERIAESRWVTKEEFLTDAYPVSHESLKRLIKREL